MWEAAAFAGTDFTVFPVFPADWLTRRAWIISQGHFSVSTPSTITWTNQRASSLGNVRWQTRFLIVSVHCCHLRTSLMCVLLLSCVDIICCCVLGAPTLFSVLYPTLIDWLAHCDTCTTCMHRHGWQICAGCSGEFIYSTYIVFGCTRWNATLSCFLRVMGSPLFRMCYCTRCQAQLEYGHTVGVSRCCLPWCGHTFDGLDQNECEQ